MVLGMALGMSTAAAQKPKEPEKGSGKDEKIIDASEAPKEAPLKPLKECAKFKLTNLRFEVPAPGQQALLKVHYELLKSGDFPNPVLVLRTSDGKERFVAARLGSKALNPLQDKSGDLAFGLGFARVGEKTTDLEAYLVARDRRWEDEDFRPSFKISNSVVMGDLGRALQYAREWTEAETKKLNDPPPQGPEPGANKTVGKETKPFGQPEKLISQAGYADPKKRLVVGFHYELGTFEPEKEKGKKVNCISQLVPSFHERQTSYGLKREMAKEGYAVGALNLKTNPTVTAFQVVYMKIKSDKTLDPKDTYTSDWDGEPGPDDKEGTLSGGGKKVIGANVWSWGRVFAVALVVD